MHSPDVSYVSNVVKTIYKKYHQNVMTDKINDNKIPINLA
jgi:hypothetical protein